jgi:soluble lytic murein transglycosylase-like protein
MSLSLSAALLLALPAAPPADLRLPLVEMRLAGQTEAALAATEQALRSRPEESARLGLSYLRARLLEDLGRPLDATEALGAAFDETVRLRPYVRHRLAMGEEKRGHPEVAAGLVASVIQPSTPADLLERSVSLLGRTLAAGGDCRVLGNLRVQELAARARRAMTLMKAECALRSGDLDHAAATLRRLLQEGREDESARVAADRLDTLLHKVPAATRKVSSELAMPALESLIGLTLFQHREYDRAIPRLERALAAFSGTGPATDSEFETRYALARSYFWREQFAVAALRFAEIVPRARNAEERSLVLYQQARSLELSNDPLAAIGLFRRAHQISPAGEWGGPALFAALRLEWRAGREASALLLYNQLTAQRGNWEYASRAALFLACGEIVQGKLGRAGLWLADALRFDRDSAVEVDYWFGRLAELETAEPDRTSRAVRYYLAAALRDPYHPLSRAGLARARSGELLAAGQREGRRRAGLATAQDRLAAWLLLGDGDPVGRLAKRQLQELYAAHSEIGVLYRAAPSSLATWPLWPGPTTDPEAMLLALGLFDEGAPAVGRTLVGGRPEVALAVAGRLADANQFYPSLALADGLARQLERVVPGPFLPLEVRRRHFPLGWPKVLTAQGRRFGVDPRLIAAIVREESKWDPRALSPASARGLGQFVWLTAKRLAAAHGLGAIRSEDLYRPEVSLTLSASYLAELLDRARGAEFRAVAAYNAGPAQADLWQGYCNSTELAEYFTKTSFKETRAYLRRVLGGYAVYQELYPTDGLPL